MLMCYVCGPDGYQALPFRNISAHGSRPVLSGVDYNAPNFAVKMPIAKAEICFLEIEVRLGTIVAMDVFSAKKRSLIMSHITGKDTAPEIIVRRYLHGRGLRFRVNIASLPGKPDIVIPKYRAVVFVHGCFWHGHGRCRKGRNKPKTNAAFWRKKNYRQ